MYHSLFALWEYILLRKYKWFEDGIFIAVDEAVDPPADIRLIFIVQMVFLTLSSNS